MVGGLWLQNYAAWRRILLQESFPLVQAILSIMNAIMTASAYHASSLARGRDTKGGGWTCWAGKESWTSGGEWHQDSKTQLNQNQNSLLQPMRFVNRRIYMIPSICSEICWFSRYYNNNNNNNWLCLLHDFCIPNTGNPPQVGRRFSSPSKLLVFGFGLVHS